jgi:hypothetical protein
MDSQIYVIGYYNHNNIGDEQYKDTITYLIKKYIPKYNVTFIDSDLLETHPFQNTDIIIVGGGDVLNNYFLDKIIAKFNSKPNKIIGLSVGIPYINILNTSKLDIFDYIFIRTKQDLEILQEHYYPSKIFYLPDLSYFITQFNELNIIGKYQLLKKNTGVTIQNNGSKIITFCLSRHIYHKDYLQNYQNIITTIYKFIETLIHQGYHIVLLPFNTNNINPNENDILINRDIYNLISNDLQKYITLIDSKLEPVDTNIIISLSYAVIAMRFHACLFAIHNNIPFLPLFTTRKINNLLLDISWNHGCKLEVNSKDLPINIDYDTLLKQFELLVTNYTANLLQLQNTNTFLFGKEMNNVIYKLINVIELPYEKSSKIKKYYKSADDISSDVYNRILAISNNKGYSHLYNIKDTDTKELIVQIVSYHLTQNINSVYNYGLTAKIFTEEFNYLQEFKWIIDDFSTKKVVQLESNKNGLFNINHIDQIDYSGVHRSGWQYVYDKMLYLHNDHSDLIVDMYLDKTFTWNSEINNLLENIPYTKKWVGFLHHTFDTSFNNKNNCHVLFDNPLFIKSLETCKGLFVLSGYLKSQVEVMLFSKGINIKVYNFVHPTEIDVPQFDMKKFKLNPDKKLLHIGGWLRDIYSFYKLDVTTLKIKERLFKTTSHTITKCVVKGKYMNNYFPEPFFLNKLYNILCSNPNCSTPNCSTPNCSTPNCSTPNCSTPNCSMPNCSMPNCSTPNCSTPNCSTPENNITNNWYKLFYKDIKSTMNTVTFQEHLENDEYDKLFIDNIVFLNVVDCSAVNTLIECIVRNTPIIVNKHPAIVELLGEKYPLYFNDIKEIEMLLNNIESGYKYLKKLNKEIYCIDYFTKTFVNVIKSID